MNKKISQLFLFGIFALTLVLLSMNFVSAVTATFIINTPANNANLTGTYTFNTTVNASNTVNVTVNWWNGTSGTYALLASNSSNPTADNLSFAFSIDTTALNANVSSSIFNITSVETGGVAANSTNKTGIVIDNTAPTIFLLDYANGTIRNNTNLTINISVVDINMTRQSPACIVNVNGTNQTLPLTVINATYGTCNTTTLSLAGLTDGNKTVNIYAGRNSTYWNANLTDVLASSVVFIDSNAPTVELTSTSIEKNDITLAIATTEGSGTGVSSCTADRSGAVVTTTTLTESGLACATTYTYVVTCSDKNGHAASATKTVSTNACGSVGGSSTSTTSTPKPSVNYVSEIKPGAASVVKYSDATLGVKQIEITVNNPAQNVKVSVTKYDGKPAEVSVAKTGKIYQYLQISVDNVKDKLNKATIQFKVEKSKVTNKDNIVVSKFDETNKKWNDLATTYASEDTAYYYYNAEVSSFSYFAISEKSVASEDTTKGTDTTGTGSSGTKASSLTWLWILIAIVILAAIGYWAMNRNK